ncbi:MAG: HEAT repeat domain-containing protein [Candidatus Bathyarchaeia archaeon]
MKTSLFVLLCALTVAAQELQSAMLVEQYRASSPEERVKLLPLLVQAEPKLSLEFLKAAMWDEDWALRGRGASLAGKTPELHDRLLQLSSDRHWFVRGNAATGLGEMLATGQSEVAYLYLGKLVKDKEPFVRQRVAAALGKVRTPQSAALLATLMADTDTRVRWEVALALVESGSESALATLKTADLEPYIVARYLSGELELWPQIVSILARTPSPYDRRVKLLICRRADTQAIEVIRGFFKEEDRELQSAALSSLAGMRNRAATLALAEMLADESLARDEDYRKWQLEIVTALSTRPEREAFEGLLARVFTVRDREVGEALLKAISDYRQVWAVERLLELHSDERKKPAVEMILGRMGITSDALIQSLKSEPSWYSGREAIRWYRMLGEGSLVEPLLLAMSHSDASVRREAATIAGETRESAYVEPLLPLLEDSAVATAARLALERLGLDRTALQRGLNSTEWRTRADAASMCGRMGYLDLVPLLLKASTDARDEVRAEAITALSRLRQGVEVMIRALDDTSLQVRVAAAAALGSMREQRAVMALVRTLGGHDVTLAGLAAEAILNTPDKMAVPYLLELLRSPRWRVRSHAARVLGAWREERAVMQLLMLLEDKAAPVRYFARSALINIGEASVKPLIDALAREGGNRQAVAHALASIGSRAVPALCALLSSTGQPKISAAIVLGEIGDSRAVAPLVEALDDERFYVRDAVALALGRMGEAALEPLLHAGRSKQPARRAGAAMALKYLGRVEALELLRELMDDKETQVRVAAVEAFAVVGGRRVVAELQRIAEKDRAESVRMAARSSIRTLLQP